MDEKDVGALHAMFLSRLIDKVNDPDVTSGELGVIERFLRANHVTATPSNKKITELSELYEKKIPFPSVTDIDTELLN